MHEKRRIKFGLTRKKTGKFERISRKLRKK